MIAYPNYLKNRWTGKIRSSEKLYWTKLLYTKLCTVMKYSEANSLDFYVENGSYELDDVIPAGQYIDTINVIWDGDLQDEDVYGNWYDAPEIMYTPAEFAQWMSVCESDIIYDASAIEDCVKMVGDYLRDHYEVVMCKIQVEDMYESECVARILGRDVWVPGREAAKLNAFEFKF